MTGINILSMVKPIKLGESIDMNISFLRKGNVTHTVQIRVRFPPTHGCLRTALKANGDFRMGSAYRWNSRK